jgi:hypothetical protein
VLGVGEHSSGRAGVGNALVPKRDHLVQRRRNVAHLTEGLPQNTGKALPEQILTKLSITLCRKFLKS